MDRNPVIKKAPSNVWKRLAEDSERRSRRYGETKKHRESWADKTRKVASTSTSASITAFSNEEIEEMRLKGIHKEEFRGEKENQDTEPPALKKDLEKKEAEDNTKQHGTRPKLVRGIAIAPPAKPNPWKTVRLAPTTAEQSHRRKSTTPDAGKLSPSDSEEDIIKDTGMKKVRQPGRIPLARNPDYATSIMLHSPTGTTSFMEHGYLRSSSEEWPSPPASKKSASPPSRPWWD